MNIEEIVAYDEVPKYLDELERGMAAVRDVVKSDEPQSVVEVVREAADIADLCPARIADAITGLVRDRELRWVHAISVAKQGADSDREREATRTS